MPNASKNSPAFTLFELLIVVVLIAIIYGVFIQRLQSVGKAETRITLQTLPELLDTFPEGLDREVICTEPCKECRIYIDGKPVKGDAFALFAETPPVWTKDRYGQMQQKTFLPLYDPDHGIKEVCFRYRRFRNGSGSHYIVQNGETRFVRFPAYLHPVRTFSTLEAAEGAEAHAALLPTEARRYTF